MYSGWLFSVQVSLLSSLIGGWYALRMLRAKYRAAAAIWITAYFAVQLASAQMSDAVYPATLAVGALLSLVAFLALAGALFRGDAAVKLFAAFSFVAGSEIVKFIASALSYMLLDLESVAMWNATHGEMAMVAILAACAALQFTLLFCFVRVIAGQRVSADRPYRLHEKLFLIIPSFTALCIAVTLRMAVISVDSSGYALIYGSVPATKFLIPFICLLLLATILSAVYLFQKMLQGHEEERKRTLLENQIAQMQSEVEEIQDIYADMRSLRHDLRGHLANISALAAADHADLPEYIGKMEATIERLDFPSETGNPITDVIIRRKCQEAGKKCIPFHADFLYPSHQQIDAYDIGIILDNALENALEACQAAAGAGGIALRSYGKGNLFFIEVENAFDGTIAWNEKTGLPFSRKGGGQEHGIGLSNIQRCARKYSGDIDIEISHTQGKSTFQLTVMMCGKDFTPEKP